MTEREKQAAFLKSLLQRDESEQGRHLHEQVITAERHEQFISKAIRWVALLGFSCLVGLGYEAVFVADFFANPTHLLTRVLGYLGLASVFSLVMFLGDWLWHRALSNRLYEQCRRMLR